MKTEASEYLSLLQEIQNNNVSTFTVMPADEPRFTIETNSRNIIVPSEFSFLSVQNDHRAETIYFEIDRYFDNVDLSQHTCVVQFINKSGTTINEGTYPVTSMDIDSVDGKIVFGWEIRNDATQLTGDITFSVRFYSIDNNGNFTYNFNTLTASSYILPSLNIIASGERITATELEVWTDKMNNLASSIESDIITVEEKIEELENYIASIPEDYTALTEEVSQHSIDIADLYNTKAPAIIQKASGTVFAMKDSAKAGFEDVVLFGRSEQKRYAGNQLLDMTGAKSGTNMGVTVTVNEDGSYTRSGTAEQNTINVWLFGAYATDAETLFILPAGTYYVSGVRLFNGTSSISPTNDGSFTLSEDTPITGVRISLCVAGTTYNDTVYPMLNAGTEALPWEPYVGGQASPNPQYKQDIKSVESVDAGVLGGNLLENNVISSVKNGLTWNNENDKLHLNGTTTALTNLFSTYENFVLKKGKYTLGCEISGTVSGILMLYSKSNTLLAKCSMGASKRFEITEDTAIDRLVFQISEGVTLNGTVGAILNYGTELLSFEPYQKQPLTLNRVLRGIPVTDASLATYTDKNGQMWCADYINEGQKVLVQRVGHKKLTKDLPISKSITTAIDRYLVRMDNTATPNGYAGYCSHAWLKSDSNAYINTFRYDINDGTTRFAIDYAEAGTTDLNTFKTFLDENDVYCDYILATPIEIPLTDEEIAALEALHSNYPVTTFISDVHTEVGYVTDTKLYIDNKFAEMAAAMVAGSEV